MTQFATVDRFCAIEDTSCNKRIPFKGPWTYFFAYPSNRHLQGFTKELASEMEARGIQGVRWEDLVGNDLLFSKVCDEIYANDFLLAEVTEPNLNVLLEVGYALAVGRQPLLLQDKNRVSWTRQLLTTLESCHYATREDIHEHIARWQAGSTESSSPNRRLPFLDNMGIYDDQEVRGTIYHLKPKVSTDWIGRVDKVLEKSYFKSTAMDPSDSVYDEFYPQARQIQRTSLIVASFVSTDHIGWEEKNANVALLTGFSIGLGKQVLVLQQQPITPILDLGSVSRPFETEDQVQTIVDAWIDKQIRVSVGQTLESRRQASTKRQVDFIRNIYLGHPDALQDNELLNYFVPTKEFDDAMDGRRTIFIGRRGAGKSANFRAIRAEIADQPRTIGVEILPDDFQLERISNFIESMGSLSGHQVVFQSIWNYVLTTEMLNSLADKTDYLFASPEGVARANLRYIYETEHDNLALDFGSRTILALERVLPATHGGTPEGKASAAEKALQSLWNHDLGRRLRDAAREEAFTFFVVADDLDKHWHAKTAQSIDLLLGLVAEISRMQRYFGPNLKVVLFLREDIYDILTRYDDDLPKRDIVRMEWTPANLHHLVATRLALTVSGENDEDAWAAIFPEPVKNVAASKYILTRSLPRPRDVLNLCQKAIDHAQRNGHTYVTAEDILDGEKSFSETLFYSVASEFKGIYPDLEEVLIEFAGVPQRTSWSEFEDVALKAIGNNNVIVTKWVDGSGMTSHHLTEVLFRIGLIGLSREWTSSVHFCNGRSFSETWGLVAPAPVVHIHPAFAQFLEISEAVLRQPQRASRKDKRTSSLQLSLDDELK